MGLLSVEKNVRSGNAKGEIDDARTGYSYPDLIYTGKPDSFKIFVYF